MLLRPWGTTRTACFGARCPPPDANPLLALVSNDLRLSTTPSTTKWHRGEQAIEYAHGNRLDGVIRATTTLFAVAFAVGCGIAVVATHHEWANNILGSSWPATSPNNSFRRHHGGSLGRLDDAPLKASVVHLALQAAFSALLVYTPADGYYAEDQRFPVRHGCGDVSATRQVLARASPTLSPSIPWPTWCGRVRGP